VSGTSSEPERLLDLVAGHVLEHGTSGQSLSGLARAIGSNNRMLLYYFESKENLLDRACSRALQWFPVIAGALGALHAPGDLGERLHAVWLAIVHPDNRPFLFERYGTALRDPAANETFLDRMGTAGWPSEVTQVLLADGVEPEVARRCGVEVVGLWRGLQLSLLSGVPVEELSRVHLAWARRLALDLAGDLEPVRNRAAART
jgi:AcrR family transcriptional regulator